MDNPKKTNLCNNLKQKSKTDAVDMALFLIGFFVLGGGLFYGNLMAAGNSPFVVAIPSVFLSLVGVIIFKKAGSFFSGVLFFYLLISISIIVSYFVP